jgi:hypothetical protein
MDGLSRWPVIQRVARKARRHGYAAEPVDGAFLYVALYDEDGFGAERLERLLEPLAADVVRSGIFPAEEGDRNALLVHTVPAKENRSPAPYLPFFLYPLPLRSILDLLNGRMLLFNLFNPAPLATALQRAGFEVQPKTGSSFLGGLDVSAYFETTSGGRSRLRLDGLQSSIEEMVMEFRSLDYAVRVAATVRDQAAVSLGALEGEPQEVVEEGRPAAG